MSITQKELKQRIDTALAGAKEKQKPQKVYIGKGLLLQVTPKEQVYWRFKYRVNNKEKSLSFGVFPEITLKRANEKLREARDLLDKDIDPSEYKKQIKNTAKDNLANSFEVIAREWFAKFKSTWSDTHGKKIITRLEKIFSRGLGTSH